MYYISYFWNIWFVFQFNSKPSAADVFKLLTSGTAHDYLTRDDITHLSDDKIASLSRVLKYGQFPVTIKKRVEL